MSAEYDSLNALMREEELVRALSREEKLAIAERIILNIEDCCTLVYPKRFTFPFAEGHYKIFHALRNPAINLLAIAAPRGMGKSSILQLAYPTQRILARDTGFIVPVSCTSRQALLYSENLKRELRSNRIITNIFGSMESNLFGQEMWMANNPIGNREGTLVLPRAVEMQIRGISHGDDRPDLFLLDDIENPEAVLSEDRREKLKEWLYGDVLGSRNDSVPNKVVVIGTVLGEDSLLYNLLKDENWHGITLELCDDECNSMWPARYSKEDILAKRKLYMDRGLLDVFYREYRNIPQSPDGSPFQSRFFKYYDPTDIDKSFVTYFIIIDPAKSRSENACDTAIVGVGVDFLRRRFYVEDIIAARLHPDETAEQACMMAKRLNARQIGIEKTGSGLYVTWPLENYIRMNGLGIEVIGLDAKKGPSQYVPTGSAQPGKDSRIGAALVPLYRQGLIYHNQNCGTIGALETQLLTFPRSEKKDIMDALAYVVAMMEIGERFFAMPIELESKSIKQGTGMLDSAREDKALEVLYGGSISTNWRKIPHA